MFFDKKLLTNVKTGIIVNLTINIKKLFFIVLLSCKSKKSEKRKKIKCFRWRKMK